MSDDALEQARREDGARKDGTGSAGMTHFWRHLGHWAERVRLGRKVALLLIVAALVSGVVTYAALTDS